MADLVLNTIVVCKVCGMSSELFGEADVLKRYRARYFRCATCGFIQTEEPYWLEEAYSSAIGAQDVGIIQRNIVNCAKTSAVLNLLFPMTTRSVDYGAGHGILVRMMRDRGFDFSWSDLHATNDYARGFEVQGNVTYDFLTAFEVLEHMTDPVSDLSAMMSLSDNVFVSTCLVPQPVPRLSEWWYYSLSGGQHISFYTIESLRLLAARFERNLLSVGSYHLFTKERKSSPLYRLATNDRTCRIVNTIFHRRSLTDSDYLRITR